MNRIRIIACLACLFISCTVSPPAEEPLVAYDAEEELLTEIRTYKFEENYRELRPAGKRYLERYGDSPGSVEVRLLLGAADVELGFFDEAAEILTPLLDESVAYGGEQVGDRPRASGPQDTEPCVLHEVLGRCPIMGERECEAIPSLHEIIQVDR